MLKANELRIGNWVYIPQTKTNEQIGVIEENGRFLTKGYKTSYSSIECSRPIPLTEEWLKRFGFDYDMDVALYSKSGYDLCVNDNNSIYFYLGEYGSWFKNIQHVHTLQNLYFALTGEELKLKDDDSAIHL
jgi:hypothetical protein